MKIDSILSLILTSCPECQSFLLCRFACTKQWGVVGVPLSAVKSTPILLSPEHLTFGHSALNALWNTECSCADLCCIAICTYRGNSRRPFWALALQVRFATMATSCQGWLQYFLLCPCAKPLCRFMRSFSGFIALLYPVMLDPEGFFFRTILLVRGFQALLLPIPY